ncbi:MAG: hypothetical protein GF355_15630 [Candidatus Eisenbacteria bacterium]|nr:hypothetical protein [Candidatus Eisenbacteria bacterium]
MRLIIAGIALFLFIPLVLFLYLAQPLGVLPSLGLGIAIMLGHRFVARPFSERHRTHRCLWCGRPLPIARVTLSLPQGKGAHKDYTFCPPSEQSCRRRWVGLHRLAGRQKHLLRLGVFGPLLFYLVVEAARGLGNDLAPHALASAVFRGGIAATVVSVSFSYLLLQPEGDPVEGPARPFPFPIHNLTLLGAGWTLWIFRVVGIWWLVQVTRQVARGGVS